MIGLRSDIERKRLAGLDALARSGSRVDSGIYTRDFSRRTYEHLARLAESLLGMGWGVLVDATFIACWQRDLFREVAARCGVPLYILDFAVPDEVLRQRVQARRAAGGDASEADVDVLEHQLRTQEPLAPAEMEGVIRATTVDAVTARIMRPPASGGQ
jgi:predicted kinase